MYNRHQSRYLRFVIDPLVGSALIAGAATLVGGAASAGAKANLNKKNREWQEKMYERQLADQREDREAAYNMTSAPAVAQQLKQAGINPQTAAGVQGDAKAVSSSFPSPVTTPYDMSFVGQAVQDALAAKKLEADIDNVEADTKAKQNQNNLYAATFNEQIEQIKELLREKKISNDQAELLFKLNRDAYFNEDGTIKDNPYKVELDIKHLDKQIREDESARSTFNRNFKEMFGIDLTTLPPAYQADLSSRFAVAAAQGMPDEMLNSISAAISNMVTTLKHQEERKAYEIIPYLNEIEESIDRLIGLAHTFPVDLMPQWVQRIMTDFL